MTRTFTVYEYDTETNEDDTYDNAAFLQASNLSSTAPGDSGGPLFKISYCPDDTRIAKAYLVGATLGANMSPEGPHRKKRRRCSLPPADSRVAE